METKAPSVPAEPPAGRSPRSAVDGSSELAVRGATQTAHTPEHTPRGVCSRIEEVKGKELVRRLRRAGVEVAGRQGGTGHLVARYQGNKAPVPMHGDRDIGPDFIKRLCKELGLDPRRVL